MLDDIFEAGDADRDGLISEDEFFRREPLAKLELVCSKLILFYRSSRLSSVASTCFNQYSMPGAH